MVLHPRIVNIESNVTITESPSLHIGLTVMYKESVVPEISRTGGDVTVVSKPFTSMVK